MISRYKIGYKIGYRIGYKIGYYTFDLAKSSAYEVESHPRKGKK